MEEKYRLCLPTDSAKPYEWTFDTRIEALRYAERLLKTRDLVWIIRNQIREEVRKPLRLCHFLSEKTYNSIDEMEKDGLILLSDMITNLDDSGSFELETDHRVISIPIINSDMMITRHTTKRSVVLNTFWCDKPIFISIPKCGSVSINQHWTFFRKDLGSLGHIAARFFPRKFRGNMITMVRNPYDRLVSAYYFMIRGGFNQNPEYLEIGDDFKSFEDWVINGVSEEDTVPRTSSGAMEVTIPQAFYLLDEDGELCLKKENIGRFENFTSEVARLVQLNIQQIFNESNHPEWQSHYSNEQVRKKVERLYAKDFELLKYPFFHPVSKDEPPPLYSSVTTPPPTYD